MTTKTMNPKMNGELGAKPVSSSRMDVRRLATMAMLVALAYVVTSVTRFPLVSAAPYRKYDPKDVVLAIGGFLYGPASAAIMSLATCLIEMVTVSESGPVGFLMNLLASLAFILPASLIYQKRRTLGGAVAGLAVGVALMTGTMLLWNYIITPFYEKIAREVVAAKMQQVFLPFNLVKGSLNMALTLVLYQPVNNALRRAHLLPALPGGQTRRRINLGILALGVVLLAICLFLVFRVL